VRKRAQTRFSTIFSIFDHFLHFLPDPEMERPAVRWKEFLRLEDAGQDKACPHQDLFRAMDAERIRHFRASIHGPMSGSTRRKPGILATFRLVPPIPRESCPAARELYNREKENVREKETSLPRRLMA
jgi:hypothetical protein